MAEEHAADMDELLTRHQDFVHEHAADPVFFALEQEALDLIARITRLTTGDRRAPLRPRRGTPALKRLRPRRHPRLRTRNGTIDTRRAPRRRSPVASVRALPAQRTRLRALPREARAGAATASSDAVAEEADAPRTAAAARPSRRTRRRTHGLLATTSLAELVVREGWEQAVERENALVCAYDRRRRNLPQLEFSSQVEEVRRGGVRRISHTLLHPETETSP